MNPGSVVVVDFVGANETKRRPAIVISSETYHQERPDLLVALITSKIEKANTSTDHVLRDWAVAGLKKPSAVRMYIQTYPASRCRLVGNLSDHDWERVRAVAKVAVAG